VQIIPFLFFASTLFLSAVELQWRRQCAARAVTAMAHLPMRFASRERVEIAAKPNDGGSSASPARRLASALHS
jgi:hypothetical protein